MEDLKPCPFCGKTDKLEKEMFLDLVGWLYRVKCNRCPNTEPIMGSMEDAVKLWNTRPVEDALKAEVERLKEELDAQKSVSKIAYSDIKWLCEEVEKWKKMFYNLDDKHAKVLIEIRRKRGER